MKKVLCLLTAFFLLSFPKFTHGVEEYDESTDIASSVFTVNTISDSPDMTPGDGICKTQAGKCSLRAAITEANKHEGRDNIYFSIPGTGVHTISLTSSLPELTDQTGGTVINGYTQPGSVPNSDLFISNAKILIEIKGQGEAYRTIRGLGIISPSNKIRGLAIYHIYNPIHLHTADAHDNRILGNFLGTNSNASYSISTSINLSYGVRIETGAHNNTIGNNTLKGRNVISNNGDTGVWLVHPGTNENQILGNIIGLSPLGDRKMPNWRYGVDLNSGPSSNIFSNNVVSGNADVGMEISHLVPGTGGQTEKNVFDGNFIGTTASGNSARDYTANRNFGVRIKDGVTGNIVKNNVVGNNGAGGIFLENAADRGFKYTTNNTVSGNRVGISLSGKAIPNGFFGIRADTKNSTIGPNNIIANNSGPGILTTFDDATSNTITHNEIFDNTGLGIDLPSSLLTSSPTRPQLANATSTSLSGVACANCTIEAFVAASDPSGSGEGKTFLGVTTADSDGNFSVVFAAQPSGTALTTTSTDNTKTTSEFSKNILIP